MRRRGESIVRFELDHRPDGDAHRLERILERLKLRQQVGLDSFAGLVVGPEIVAERLDDVIGGDTDVRRTGLDHLQHRVQYARDGAEGFVLALVPAALAVEVAEQLIRSVDQVDYHLPEMVTSKYPL